MEVGVDGGGGGSSSKTGEQKKLTDINFNWFCF